MNETGRVAGGTCRTCSQTWDWHQENRPIHPFNDGQAGATAFLGPRRDRTNQPADSGAQRDAETAPTVVWPSDPVLRVALINKGVLTADDLRAAEENLRAAMGPMRIGDKWSATGEGSTAT